MKQSGGSGMANSSKMVWGKGPQELYPLLSDLRNYFPGFGGYCPFDAPSGYYGQFIRQPDDLQQSDHLPLCNVFPSEVNRILGYLSPDMSCSKGILVVCINVPFCFPWPISMPELRPLFLSLGQCASWTELVTKGLLPGP